MGSGLGREGRRQQTATPRSPSDRKSDIRGRFFDFPGLRLVLPYFARLLQKLALVFCWHHGERCAVDCFAGGTEKENGATKKPVRAGKVEKTSTNRKKTGSGACRRKELRPQNVSRIPTHNGPLEPKTPRPPRAPHLRRRARRGTPAACPAAAPLPMRPRREWAAHATRGRRRHAAHAWF